MVYNSLSDWLRDRIIPIKKENRHLFIGFPADVYRAVYLISGMFPICVSSGNFNPPGFFPIPVLNCQSLSANDYAHALIGVNVPGCCFARLEH